VRESHAPRIVWVLTTALALSIIGLIIGAPLARAHGHLTFASTVYEAFSLFCHQISGRSFHVDGDQFAVCSRCTGLYSGFAVAALAYPLTRSLKCADMPPGLWLLVAAVPLAIDVMLGHFAIWPNTHLSRFSTGVLLGAMAVFFVMPGLIALSTVDWRDPIEPGAR
jgi:uncharacterized membrane protein